MAILVKVGAWVNTIIIDTGTAGGTPSGDAALLETADYILLETGDFLLLE